MKLLMALLAGVPVINPIFANYDGITRFSPYGLQENRAAFAIRLAADYLRALGQIPNNLPAENNGDEKLVPGYASQFTKTFEHDPSTGLVTAQGQTSYQQLVTAMNSGLQADFNAIIRYPSSFKLVNPQAGLAFCMEGCDSSLFSIAQFPQLSSAELAAYMIELYLMQLCRDVQFNQYGTGLGSDSNGSGGSLTNDAAAVLQDLGSAYMGPRNSFGVVDASVLFRGDSYGSLAGPYVSQFALLSLKTPFMAGTGAQNLNPAPFIKLVQQWPIAQGRQFGVSFADFVAIENGTCPKPYTANDYDPVNKRYIITGRDWGSFVHFDINCESFFYAAYILNGYGFPYSLSLPYYNGAMPNEGSFATMGMVEMFSMLEGVSVEAMKASWAQKWRCNRALRPEAFGGLVQQAEVTASNPFSLDTSLFVSHAGINVLNQVLANNTLQANYPDNNLTQAQAATYLFAQMYPEGSPNHPTYPSGHATIAGACATILKAFFEDTTLITTVVVPVQPNPSNPTQLIPLSNQGENLITVASELDKLASNVAMARSFAGVHYRIDGEQGILLGEAVAIKYLQDHCMNYNEQAFTGYVITKRDGTRIRITADTVTVI